MTLNMMIMAMIVTFGEERLTEVIYVHQYCNSSSIAPKVRPKGQLSTVQQQVAACASLPQKDPQSKDSPSLVRQSNLPRPSAPLGPSMALALHSSAKDLAQSCTYVSKIYLYSNQNGAPGRKNAWLHKMRPRGG